MRSPPPRLLAKSALWGFSASAVFVLCVWIAAVLGTVPAIQLLIDLTSARANPLSVLVEHAFPELFATRSTTSDVLLACVWVQVGVVLTAALYAISLVRYRGG